MMAGNVEPPKIFLRASAVLERQFVAYCMDCWVKKGVPEDAIPKKINMCISKIEERSEERFPFNFLKYVQNNLSSLQRTFKQMFTEDLDDTAKEELDKFAIGDSFKESPIYLKIYEAFKGLKEQRDALSASIKQLNILIKELEGKPKDSSYDKEIKDLKSERYALSNVVKSINKKSVFNFLSDEGLLPNYAFPESGIILKAVLLRRETEQIEAESNKRKYKKMVYEYNRSASSAISEFAPLNNFYVDGRKLEINQIDLSTSKTAKWRLCPSCSHVQIEETGKNTASCPQCGSIGWADVGQVKTMLKVQMVYSNMDYTKSLIGDDSDDRSSVFYVKQLLVDVDEANDINKAYSMNNDEFQFGYEFVKKATLREINYGERELSGEKMTVAGNEEVRKGFKVCKHCGTIQPKKGKEKHTKFCRANQAQSALDNPIEDCLFLYREFQTEALRILIPATTMDATNVRQESFTAAFMLGMQQYFGNVDHLRACLSEVPVPNAAYRKQYLVIYDSVPGGTGYLKQLLQNENSLVEIFEKTLAVMEQCSCRFDDQKDGCYHCLYAYRQSNNIGKISRSEAIRMLKQILSGKDNIEEIEKLANVPVNDLFESELERRFVEAFEVSKKYFPELTINKELVNEKEGYRLSINGNIWEIEPQVEMEQYGSSLRTRADFVLWPKKVNGDQNPVAIYTDGFSFHKNSVAEDSLRREAVRRTGKFRVWSLSYKDVQSVFEEQGDYFSNALDISTMPGLKAYKPIIENEKALELTPDRMKLQIHLLFNYLSLDDAERLFIVHSCAYSISLLNLREMKTEISFNNWLYDFLRFTKDFYNINDDFKYMKSAFGSWAPRNSNSHLKMLSGIKISDMRANGTKAMATVCAVLDDKLDNRTDKYEAEWNGFWQFFNFMQFLPEFVGVTTTGLERGIYDELTYVVNEIDETHEVIDNGEWELVIEEIIDDEAITFARKLIELGVQAPTTVGYEIVDSKGAVIAECEMVWVIKKIALLLEYQLESKDVFEADGWKIITIDQEIDTELFKGGTE